MKKNKREMEEEILAQMDEAMQEEACETSNGKPKRVGFFKDKTPDEMHCHKCGTLMEHGKCPACGHTVYVPMDERKKNTIRWIVGGVCLAAFIIVFVITRLK